MQPQGTIKRLLLATRRMKTITMTLYEFNVLDEERQADAVWEHGVHLCNRKHGSQWVALYQIEAFYVEVYYNGKQNRITKLRSFLSTEALKPYLHLISIEGFN